MNGLVIAFDGPDGVGKTTQLNLLAESLKQAGHNVHTTRHNGGSPIGEELRKVSLSPVERSAQTDFYISLAMGQALSEEVQERKKRGEIVLIDRSPLAIVAYQAYGGQLEDKQPVFEACSDLFKSEMIDALVFLDAPQQIIDNRRQQRNTTDYFESKGEEFHSRVKEGYKAALEWLKRTNNAVQVVRADASGEINTIQETIEQAITPLISKMKL